MGPLVSILKSGIAGPLPALIFPGLSVFYAPLRQNTFLIGVFHLAHSVTVSASSTSKDARCGR